MLKTKDLVKIIHEETGIPLDKSALLLGIYQSLIIQEVANNGKFSLPGLCTFRARKWAAPKNRPVLIHIGNTFTTGEYHILTRFNPKIKKYFKQLSIVGQ